MATTTPLPTTTQPIQKRVAIGTISNYIGQAATFAAWFILTPLILRNVGVVAYGLWALIGSVVAYGSLLDFGIWGAIIKYVAEFRAQGKTENTNALISTALTLYIALAAIVILVSCGLAPFFPTVFNIATDQRETSIWLFAAMGSAVGIVIPCMTPLAILRGLQRYDYVNIVNLVGTVFEFISIIVLLQLGWGIWGLVFTHLAGTLIMQIPALFFIRHIDPSLQLNPFNAKRSLLPLVARYSTPLFAMDIAGRLQTKSDEITIGAFLTVVAVTPYALMRKLSEATHLLTKQFMKVLLPLASALNATQDRARLQDLYITGTRLTLAIFLPIATILILLAAPILHFWLGDEYTSYIPVMAILTVASLAATSQWPAAAVLQGIARHRLLGVTAMGSGIANLVISISLIHPFGLIGVAIGTLIPTLIENWGIILPYTLQQINIRPATVWQNILLPAVLPVIPMGMVVYGLQKVGNPYTLPFLLLIATVGFLVYGITYLLHPAAQHERQFTLSIKQRLLP